jgi:Coenzyme PQQ synthesis protein D (PqqD)
MRTLFVATAGLETAPLADGCVVYNLKTGKFVMLNRSANRIWGALTRPLAEQDLADVLRASYAGLDAPSAAKAVSQALVELQRHELVAERGGDAAVARPQGEPGKAVEADGAYAPPSVKLLDEEDLLKVFQITAAEISVASCWWGACSVGCP